MTTTETIGGRPGLVRVLLGMSLVACATQVVGAALGWTWAGWAQWAAMPPLAIALVVAGGLRDARGLWWLLGIAMSWAGDVLGGHGFLVLLACFLVAHACYLVALWPTRRDSLLASWRVVPYLVVGGTAAVVVAQAAGSALAGPIAVYAAALTLVAVLASAAGRAGLVGGILFMASDLTLALGVFVLDLPDAVQTALVMGTYVPAQVLLLVGLLGLLSAGGSRRSTG